MLLLLSLFIFVFVPLLSREKNGEIFIRIIYSTLLISGIFSVAGHKKYVRIVIIAAAVGMVGNWISSAEPNALTLVIHDLAAILFNCVFVLVILVKTFQAGEITYHRIEGSIIAYLLMGLIFAYAFQVVYLLDGATAFNNIEEPSLKEFLYFSFTSLTTMGYGDISPVHPIARSLANLEALIGQLYPAILIARLVSMEFEASSRRKGKV